MLLLNGPNLGLLGTRRPEVYGTTTLAEVEERLTVILGEQGLKLACVQSESEADLVRAVHGHLDAAGVIINPGALMMAGWSLRDALEMLACPLIEVHVSNIHAREAFRHHSVLSAIASGVICGFGPSGYELAGYGLLSQL